MKNCGYNNSKTNIYQLYSHFNTLKIQTKNHKINTEAQEANVGIKGSLGPSGGWPLCFN